MLVAIYHTKNDLLAITLTLIQPQLAEDDDIYIIDTTTEREGWDITRKYGTSRSVILTEVGKYNKSTASSFFKEYALQNQHSEILCLKNVLISTTFVSNLKKAIGISEYKILSPEILPSKEVLNPNFKWHNPTTKKVEMCNYYTESCFCLNLKGSGIGKFENEKIVLL